MAVQVVAVLDRNPVAVQRLRSGAVSRSRPRFRLWWLRAWIQRPAAGAVVEFGEHYGNVGLQRESFQIISGRRSR